VRTICEFHKFNPAEKLIAIAKNDDFDEDGRRIDWPIALRQRATEKLFDAVHGKAALPGESIADGSAPVQLVFLEASDDFALPGEVRSESAAPVLRQKEI
jgi:hypothetical protein